ncbi:S41 family peptidase [Gillisia sp. Hel_I_29]|uniref:S41 family peptidase n=1 Tax=Gillisia sp. Hel_I_29 TaxID=1249975 RepID=UPI00055611C9|nr:S41 family peptidase [Gillisia sp. Hel_I_29]
MGKKLTLLIILITSISMNAQKYNTSKDSIHAFYDTLFLNLKEGFIKKDSVNWEEIENETFSNLALYTNFKNSLNEVEPLFSKIDATHCSIYFENSVYSVQKKVSSESYSNQWKMKYDTNPGFEVKIIQEKFGYILVPSLFFTDLHPKNVNKIAQNLYNQVVEIKTGNELEGWIIDLRFNTGGNSWPMLLGLYDFLGNNNITGTLDGNKNLIGIKSLSKGKYLVDSKKQYQITPTGKLLDKIKVAIITSAVTASSGEIVAMAFKGRPNTVFIGENSLGFTSENYSSILPFNTIMALTKTYNSDRNGIYYESIVPDINVIKQDNFDNYLLDGNILEAIKFITN